MATRRGCASFSRALGVSQILVLHISTHVSFEPHLDLADFLSNDAQIQEWSPRGIHSARGGFVYQLGYKGVNYRSDIIRPTKVEALLSLNSRLVAAGRSLWRRFGSTDGVPQKNRRFARDVAADAGVPRPSFNVAADKGSKGDIAGMKAAIV
eukprot:COSAG01_NODE_438_length_17037_cov_13.150136_7_plen_152_part_00